MKTYIESTSETAVKGAANHKKKWLRLRRERSITPDRYWIFTDGSDSGWFAAVIIDPQRRTVRKLASFMAPKSRNIGPELWALLLGLKHVPTDREITVVHDYIGTGAWLVGGFQVKSPNVAEAVGHIRSVIASRGLTVDFVHHGGHQKDSSDFTRWNCVADKLCTAQKPVDLEEPL